VFKYIAAEIVKQVHTYIWCRGKWQVEYF